MKRQRKKARRRCRTFVECLTQFLTPEVIKQARRARRAKRRSPRWEVQPLLFVLLTMTWCCGDSLPERFETARAFYVACHEKRRRPGKTCQGLQDALAKLPVPVLRTVAAAVRQQMLVRLSDRLETFGWIVLGCDGSRNECPRSAELERRLGHAAKDHSPPQIWITAFVHVRTGLLWAWRLGRARASEQGHLIELLSTLPPQALIVTDAAYRGYELARQIIEAGASFLVRTSSKVWLYVDEETPLKTFSEGIVYYWPEYLQKREEPPLKLRLIRVRSDERKHDVWLLTNVLDCQRLTVAMASQFYRWRWENEGLFRTYKQTLNKVKLVSRTVKLVHREAEASLLAVQLLLAQGTQAIPAARSPWDPPAMASPRRVLIEVRREIRDCAKPARRVPFAKRLTNATRDRRPRTSSKVKRPWPRRKDHKPPRPPRILTLSDEQKDLRDKTLAAA
jgi:hypothetical protein